MRKTMMVGNWKMHKTSKELAPFFAEFAKNTKGDIQKSHTEILFAVPFTLLSKTNEIASKLGITIAAQNVNENASGAFTGEVSTEMLADINIKATLIGHSERRQYFGETDTAVAAKTLKAQAAGLLAVVCVGELLEERESNKTNDVIKKQVETALSKVANLENIILAYEPVWAIGTGKTATPQMAQEVHKLMRDIVSQKFGESAAAKVQILYGGSAKPSNIADLLEQPDIDGGLVGGASLKALDFAEMINISNG